MTTEELLEKYNVKYEDLSVAERETLHGWMKVLSEGKLSLDKVRAYFAAMRDAVENELTEPNLDKNKDIFLKARLRNYMLLEAFLSTPEKAKKALERAMAGLAPRK